MSKEDPASEGSTLTYRKNAVNPENADGKDKNWTAITLLDDEPDATGEVSTAYIEHHEILPEYYENITRILPEYYKNITITLPSH